jgi:type IX secretion system substrate protein
MYHLDSIGTIQIFAGSRRVFYLHNSFRTLSWIESVGFPGDAIYPYSANMPGCGSFCQGLNQDFYQKMNCFEHLNKVYFDSCLQHYVYQQSISNPMCTYYLDSCHYCNTCGGGISELSTLSSLEISPNPSNGKINIGMVVSKPDNLEIYIHDVTGKQVLNKFSLGRLNKGNTNRELDFSNLMSGFYLLECRGNDGSSFRKLIIQR